MAPSLEFRGQPFRLEDSTGHFLTEVLTDEEIDHVTFVVAWARFGGFGRLAQSIVEFRNRGGTLRIILGIDEGVATKAGLAMAISHSDEALVFHDPSARTFHPKIYLATGATQARLLVGSSNFTAGGLYSNYESSLEGRFELPLEQEASALIGATSYIEHLISDEGLCRPLDETLLEQMLSDPRYRIAERERRASGAPSENTDADQFGETDELGEALFGGSNQTKVNPPPVPPELRGTLRELEGTDDSEEGGDPEGTGPPEDIAPGDPDGADVEEGGVGQPITQDPQTRPNVLEWTKVLPPTDAQQPPNPNSAPTGNIRLTKAGHDIDWLVWFRHTLFADANWQADTDRQQNPIEVAHVTFDVSIAGEPYGLVEMWLDHAPHRESDQANHATVLHLGPFLPTMREIDLTGYTLTLGVRADGSYSMDFST